MTEPNDKLLDDYLGRESAVSQRYRELETAQVPSQLDAAVLAQARAAIAPRSKRASIALRWAAPVALAASAVLVVAIVLEVGLQDEVRSPAPLVESPAPADPSAQPRLMENVAAPSPPAPPAERVEMNHPPADRSLAKRVDSEPLERERKAVDATANRAASASRAAEEGMAALSDAPARMAGEQPEQASRVITQAAAPTASVESSEARDASVAGVGRAAPRAAAPTAAGQTVKSEPASVASAQAPRLAPEDWLRQIRALRRQGKVLEADEQWRAFREAYPAFEVLETDQASPTH